MSASNTLRTCPNPDCGRTVNVAVNPHHCPACKTPWGEADA